VSSHANPTRVLVVGPKPDEIGGMAGVVGQMVALDFGGDFALSCHPITTSPAEDEPLRRRCWRHLRHVRSLRRAILRAEASIVHLHTCSGFSFYRSAVDAWLARRAGCRVVVHIHGASFDQFCRTAGRLRRRLIRRVLTSADCVIALSDAWKTELFRAAPQARVVTIENAVSARSTHSTARHEGPCRFLLLAKMDEWKGVDDLLNACATLHGTGVAFEVVLAGPPGSAGDESVLTAKISDRELDGIARYVGPVRGEAKLRLLARADVYVQPSHHEGMPLAVLEAMACGLPVVASRVGGLPEVIADRHSGLLVPAGRPDLLAAAMRELAGDSAMRERQGQAGRALAETRFALGRFRDDLATLYRRLMAADRIAVRAPHPPGPRHRAPAEVDPIAHHEFAATA